MQFNSNATSQDIVSDVHFWAGTDSNSYPIADLTRNANFALDKVTSLIMRSDQKWEWDDTNNTDLPIATTDLIANQQDYSIAVTHLKILKIRIKDENGNWISLEPINRRDLNDSQLTATAATPNCYDKLGNSIFLYPKPSYSSTGGLEIQFQRSASYFVTTDTTKTPGFSSQFHRLIPLYAAFDYISVNDLPKREARVEKEIMKLENELIEFYSSRNQDEKQSLSMSRDDYGEESNLANGRGYPKRMYPY